jgi:hypothetical protein
LGGVILILAIAVVVAIILFIVLGALLIWIPVLAFLAIVAAASGLLRLRRW